MDPDKFPLILKHSKRPDVAMEHLRTLSRAVEDKHIRKVILDDIKFSLSNVVDTVWKEEVCEPYFFAGKYAEYTGELEGVAALYQSINLYGLHDCIAAKKKLDKTKVQHPAVDRMKAVVDELSPLAQTVVELKPFIVKGRAPSTGPSKPVNPNKDVKTCPCCFRGIAVMDTTMAHHGYQRPGDGYQTPSCPGVRFKPFEVSNEGTIWIRDQTKAHMERSQAYLQALPEVKMLPTEVRRNGYPVSVDIDRTHPKWDQEYRFRKLQLEADISTDRSAIRSYDERLKDWKPTVAAPSTPLPEVPSLAKVTAAVSQGTPESLQR